MKKTLIALAALAATASFAQSSVELYGRAHLAVDVWSADGTPAAANAMKSRMRLSDDSSRVGFRIREDLGGGLSASAVIEGGISLDTASANGQSGAFNSGAGLMGTREAHVALGNSTAQVRLGRQNAYWSNGAIEDTSANLIHGGVVSAYTAASSGWVNAPAARVDNTVMVVGGSALGGFAGSNVWYSFGAAGSSEAAGQGLDANANVQGLTVRYAGGKIAVQYDYAKNSAIAANTGTNVAADFVTTGNKLGVAYTYAAGSKIALIYTVVEQEFSLAATNSVALAITAAGVTAGGYRKQSSWALNAVHSFGNGLTGIAQYVIQGDVKGFATDVNDSGSTAWALGVRKDLSKRTSVSASYNTINNGLRNNIAGSGGGQSSGVIGAGASQKMIGVGIQHNF